MKLDGIEYEERMERLEEVTWPKPLGELLEAMLATYRQTHPWVWPMPCPRRRSSARCTSAA